MSRETSRGRTRNTEGFVGTLRPARFDEDEPPSGTTTTPVGTPRTLKPPQADQSGSRSQSLATGTPRLIRSYLDENTDDEDELHFTLRKSIEPSKFNQLNKLRPKLTATNYSTWSTTVYRALETVGLHVYLADDFPQPDGLDREIRKQAI
ncbi:hypothetical protein HYDPIDRAFT_34811 [Hydnomerulius pinastri MD-312]|uniref:Uncharacterized protein n=1 Tax=Hydnomerulius pinastri MD-312 TaxID=994086 RepID=A0A0C9VWX2_9AGAM|nr:hypothetical protein HYDPIDRAFT_34811 [Hydnomerulius pinastri MD-312]